MNFHKTFELKTFYVFISVICVISGQND